MNILELSEQEIVRRQSLQTLREMGIDPYPAAEFPTNAFSTDIKAEFKDEDEPRQVVIAGRMMGRRVMGKASFAELQDSKGRIQVYIARDEICPDENKDLYNTVFKKLLDIGDFIGVKGFVFRTQTGEISVHAKELCLLSKSLKPLPIVKYKDGVAYDKFDDPELRYRQRYVDLIVNDGVKETFLQRQSAISQDQTALLNTKHEIESKLHNKQTEIEAQKNSAPLIRHVLDVYPTLEDPKEQNLLLKQVIRRIDYHKTVRVYGKAKSDLHLTIHPKIAIPQTSNI